MPYENKIKSFNLCFLNLFRYGAKIRFPHAMVMTFLFRSGSLRDKFAWILRATYTHSKNLATFVLIYKTLMAIMRRMEGGKGNIHPFLSAFIGGYFVFGTHDKINEQVSVRKYLAVQFLFTTGGLSIFLLF